MTAYVLRFVWNLRTHCRNKTQGETDVRPKNGPLSPQELQCAENHWIKEVQKTLKEGEILKELSPRMDTDDFGQVGGLADKALVSSETRLPALLPI